MISINIINISKIVNIFNKSYEDKYNNAKW